MKKYILIITLFASGKVFSASDTTREFFYREMYPYNKTDTTIVDEDSKYYKKGDTILRHHWPSGYYYRDNHLYMLKDVFTYLHMTKDSMLTDPKDRVETDRVIVITCDSQVIRAIEYYNFEEGSVHPFKYIDEKTKEPIHHICQVVDWEMEWRQQKEKRINNPVYN